MFFEILVTCFSNFFFLFFFGRFIGRYGCMFFTLLSCFFLALNAVWIWYYHIATLNVTFIDFGVWFSSGPLVVNWSFVFDSLSCFMFLLVSVVSVVVHIYTFYYMDLDPFFIRFVSYLSLFTFFMVILITATNLALFLLGWEGVGLCSYLLIGFWGTRVSACKAAVKAVLFNRIGDVGLMSGLGLVYYCTRSLDFYIIYLYFPYFSEYLLFGDISLVDFVLFFFFIGVIGKSSQLGLHVWLSDAMEGPTPVSALIHAATMVTAGVYLLLRLSFVLGYSVFMSSFIAVFGILTAFLFAMVGLLQNDIKGIIAYSTCSQLGYMVACCGSSAYSIAFFHLFNHGFFKALLFLSAGLVIHSLKDEQDVRSMGGLLFSFPLVYIFFVIGSFSLMGVPFLSGFFSKDLILEYLYGLPFAWSNFAFHCGLLGAFFTAYYSFRLVFYVFISKPNGYKSYYAGLYDTIPLFVYVLLFILALFSIVSGYCFSDFFVGVGSNFFSSTLFLNDLHFWNIDFEFFLTNNIVLFFYIKALPLYFTGLGVLVAFGVASVRFSVYNFYWLFYLYVLVYQGFMFNYFYIRALARFFFFLVSEFFYFDKVFLELFGPTILGPTLLRLSFYLQLSVAYTRSFFDYIVFLLFLFCFVFIYVV